MGQWGAGIVAIVAGIIIIVTGVAFPHPPPTLTQWGVGVVAVVAGVIIIIAPRWVSVGVFATLALLLLVSSPSLLTLVLLWSLGGSNSCFADASQWGVLMRLF